MNLNMNAANGNPSNASLGHEPPSSTQDDGKKGAKLNDDSGAAGGKRKRPAKPKDPDAPKQPLSSYMLYMMENTEALKNSAHGQKMGTVAGEGWKKLTPDEKKVCVDSKECPVSAGQGRVCNDAHATTLAI